MSSPIKNMFHNFDITPYALPVAAATTGIVTINAIAKSYNICSHSGTLEYVAIPNAIGMLLPGNSCVSATGTTGLWLVTTALTAYAAHKLQQKCSSKEQPKPVNAPEAAEQKSDELSNDPEAIVDSVVDNLEIEELVVQDNIAQDNQEKLQQKRSSKIADTHPVAGRNVECETHFSGYNLRPRKRQAI